MDSLNPISNGNTPAKSSGAAIQKTNQEPAGAKALKDALPDVQVDISNGLNPAESDALMREAKVKEMRDAIVEGRFPLDARKIAENFAELEKLL